MYLIHMYAYLHLCYICVDYVSSLPHLLLECLDVLLGLHLHLRAVLPPQHPTDTQVSGDPFASIYVDVSLVNIYVCVEEGSQPERPSTGRARFSKTV